MKFLQLFHGEQLSLCSRFSVFGSALRGVVLPQILYEASVNVGHLRNKTVEFHLHNYPDGLSEIVRMLGM